MHRRLLCALLLASPSIGQTLLDLVVEHAADEELPLLVPVEVAADLESVAPRQSTPSEGRDLLPGWLASRGVALTRTRAGGLAAYQRGGEQQRRLLEAQAPLVDQEDLARANGELVWILDPMTGRSAVEEAGAATEVIELELGAHRLLGGPADAILRRLGRAPKRPAAGELVSSTAEPRSDGPTVSGWLQLPRDDPKLVFTYTDETESFLDSHRIWADGGDWTSLAGTGIHAQQVGYGLIVIEFTAPIGSRRSTRGAKRFIEDAELEDLDDLPTGEPVMVLLTLEHLDVRTVSVAMAQLRYTRLAFIPIAGEENRLVAMGDAQALRHWWRVLALADTPD